MNLSGSKALNLSHQAQAAPLFLCLILLSVLATASASAQIQSAFRDAPPSPPSSLMYVAPSDKPPPFSTNKVIGQVALGSVTGLVGGFAGGFIGLALEDCNNEDWLCGLSGALLGFSAGVIVGSSVGVYGVGRSETVEIGYGRTLLGSVAGFGTGVLILNAIDGGNGSITLIAILISPALGATLLGNTSRRYRVRQVSNGFLNWNNGQFHFGLPALQRQPLGGVPQTFVRSVRLLEVRW